MNGLTPSEEAQLLQTIEMFEVITQSQPSDYQSLEILKEAYSKLGRAKDTINTAKRIAEAYMQLGQLSSAILEYETILQQFPDDPDVRAALGEIESKAASLAAAPIPSDISSDQRGAMSGARGGVSRDAVAIEDGREAMYKLYVDAKHISAGDFDMCWAGPEVSWASGKVSDPFLQVLQDKNLMPLDKSLKVLCDKSGLGYIPLERYDIDVELARKFPKDTCQKWFVLPFDRMSKSVMVATLNPFNKQAAKELSEATKDRLIFYITPPADLNKMIKKVFR